MRRTTPLLATCLALVAGLVAWLLSGTGGDAPPPTPEETADATAAEGGEATLAARAPVALKSASSREGVLRVAVRDAKGRPAGGIRVTARRTGPAHDPNDPATWGIAGGADERARRAFVGIDAPSPEPTPDASGTTSADGACEVPVALLGQYSVRAEPVPPSWGSTTTVTVSAADRRPVASLVVGEGGALRGRVLDAQDRPVAASLAGTWSPAGLANAAGAGWSAPRTATDPATGAFAWAGVPAGKGWVHVTVPGRLKTSVTVTTPREDELLIRLAAGGIVRGRVTDSSGAPVEGADVLVEVGGSGADDGQPRGSTTRAKTSADGTYRMEGAATGRVVSATLVAEGYPARTEQAGKARWGGAEVAVGKETVLDFVLTRGAVIEGRVLVEGTGAPVPGALVQLAVPQERWNDRPEPVTADAKGAFRFEGVLVGRYVLFASSATHYLAAFAQGSDRAVAMVPGESQLADAVVAVVSREGERLEREIRLLPGLSVRGRVVGPDGAPVEGAKVGSSQIQPWNAFWRWGVGGTSVGRGEVATAADGTFRLTGLPPGDAVTLGVTKPPFTSAPTPPFRLAAGEPEPDILVTMEAGAVVTGRVLDADDAPVPGAQIQWYAQGPSRQGNGSGRAEADGSYRLEGLPPAEVSLNVWGQGRNAQVQVRPALGPGETRTGVDIRLRRAARISGVVADAQGQAVAGVRLTAAPTEPGLSHGTAVSRDDGTFEVTNLSEGSYRIGVNPSSSEYVFETPAESQQVTAPAEGIRVLAKQRLKTLVGGRVLLPDGGPVPLCTVRIGTASARQMYYGSGNPDEVVGGEFRRTVDAAPPFSLVVSAVCGADGRRLNVRGKTITVEKETTDLVITLESGLAVAGRVTDAEGKGVPDARVGAGSDQAVTDASGAFRIEGLSEGDVTLVVQPPRGFVAPASRAVRAGATDVVIVCSAGSAISGRVIGPDGEPVAQGGVSASWTGGNAYGEIRSGGTFRVEGLPADAVVALQTNVWDPRGQPLRPAKMEGVRAGTDDVVLRLEHGVEVAGTVVDADGRPLVGKYVMATSEDGNATNGQTDAQGRFTAGGLAPGRVTLSVIEEGAWRPLAPLVRVDAPATGVRIVVPRKAKLTGRLVGDKVAGFVVSARPVDTEASTDRAGSVKVGADGRFVLEVWEGVACTVSARKESDDRFALLTPVRVGAEVTLSLETGLSIDGTLVLADGAVPAQAWVWAKSPAWEAHAMVAADGTWRIRGLPKGTYRLVTSLGHEVPEPTVEAGTSGVRLQAGSR